MAIRPESANLPWEGRTGPAPSSVAKRWRIIARDHRTYVGDRKELRPNS